MRLKSYRKHLMQEIAKPPWIVFVQLLPLKKLTTLDFKKNARDSNKSNRTMARSLFKN